MINVKKVINSLLSLAVLVSASMVGGCGNKAEYSFPVESSPSELSCTAETPDIEYQAEKLNYTDSDKELSDYALNFYYDNTNTAFYNYTTDFQESNGVVSASGVENMKKIMEKFSVVFRPLNNPSFSNSINILKANEENMLSWEKIENNDNDYNYNNVFLRYIDNSEDNMYLKNTGSNFYANQSPCSLWIDEWKNNENDGENVYIYFSDLAEQSKLLENLDSGIKQYIGKNPDNDFLIFGFKMKQMNNSLEEKEKCYYVLAAGEKKALELLQNEFDGFFQQMADDSANEFSYGGSYLYGNSIYKVKTREFSFEKNENFDFSDSESGLTLDVVNSSGEKADLSAVPEENDIKKKPSYENSDDCYYNLQYQDSSVLSNIFTENINQKCYVFSNSINTKNSSSNGFGVSFEFNKGKNNVSEENRIYLDTENIKIYEYAIDKKAMEYVWKNIENAEEEGLDCIFTEDTVKITSDKNISGDAPLIVVNIPVKFDYSSFEKEYEINEVCNSEEIVNQITGVSDNENKFSLSDAEEYSTDDIENTSLTYNFDVFFKRLNNYTGYDGEEPASQIISEKDNSVTVKYFNVILYREDVKK